MLLNMEDDYQYEDHENLTFNYSYEDYQMVCEKEDVRSFARAFLPIIYTLTLVVGLAGNSLVVAIYLRYKKLRTMTDVYILNLAVADLALLLTLPFWAADAVLGWELGEAMCKLNSALYSMNFSGGMLFLACISVDRYLSVFPTRFTPTFKYRRLWLCLPVWGMAFALGLPDMVLSTVRYGATRKVCLPIYPVNMARPTKASLEILEVLLSFLLPFLVMCFCYAHVGLALLRPPHIHHGKKWRSFKVLLAVVSVFIGTQLPYNAVKFCRAMDVIYSLVEHCEISKSLDRAVQVTESLALTHSCLNPVLYAFVGASFSQHILRMVKGLGERRQRQRHMKEDEDKVEQVVEISLNSHNSSQETSTFTI